MFEGKRLSGTPRCKWGDWANENTSYRTVGEDVVWIHLAKEENVLMLL
jgi:hypothetical protein